MTSRCVDVIMPVFNGEATIQKALVSVLDQRGDYISRIIVVDDGSTDDTVSVVKALHSSVIELISTVNQGVAKARNLGLASSSAQWVSFIDADDLWQPEKICLQLDCAQEMKVEFLCGAVNSAYSRPNQFIDVKSLARGNVVSTSTVMIHRRLLEKCQPLFESDMSFAEDYLAWLKCLSLSRGYYQANVLATYHLSERPRYNWPQILKNFYQLNKKYQTFVSALDRPPLIKLLYQACASLGTCRSLLSIVKRFINSGRQKNS